MRGNTESLRAAIKTEKSDVSDIVASAVEDPAEWHHLHTTELPFVPTQRSAPASSTTLVMPYIGSKHSRRTRSLRAWMLTMPVDGIAIIAPLAWTTANWKGILATAVITIGIFALSGLYKGRRHFSILDLLPAILGRLLIAAAIVGIIAAQRHGSAEYVVEFMRTIAVSCGLVVLGRTFTTGVVVLARKKRWVEHGAIVVGSGPLAVEVARLIKRYPQYGLRFSGFVDESEGNAGHPLLIGTADDLERLVLAAETDVVIIADARVSETKLMELVRQPVLMRTDVFTIPRLCDFHSASGGVNDHIGAIPVARLHRATLTGPKWMLKRFMDLLLATVALIVVSPVMLLCALAVRIEGGPGVIFRQQRIGRWGKPFDVLKFRSMRPASSHESQTNWSVADDPRVGPIGRLLRKTSLDELPQLWNIIRGDMTFVGPRPERPFFVDRFSAEHPGYELRHRAPVGLTGLAQVSGLRGDTPISDRARFDNYYIDNWSPWLDLKVLLRTFAEVFRGGGR
ncbi:sugar transferase [Catelliglobosispora koreensis]|uniref:sugar transferase n=1 Tax=Catelliglobosispora koreensis TaxID=129052 RepID=UPI0003681555|nr:sugar transferase [Catelliglobosispora koreensis]